MATAGEGRGAGPERAWLEALPDRGEVRLDREESHHLVRVRRVAIGDEVVLYDGAGTLRRARLLGDDPRGALCEVLEPYPSRDPRPLRLAVSLPEPALADGMVATLAELGVETLLPILCERTPPGREALAARREGRWARRAREALKVNGCSRALRVEAPRPLERVLASGPGGWVLLDPDPALPPLAGLPAPEGPLPGVLVGPEGGFSEGEVRAVEAAGGRRLRLGRPALRTGTAAAAAAALLLAR